MLALDHLMEGNDALAVKTISMKQLQITRDFRILVVTKLVEQMISGLGPISQRDLSPDLDLNLRLWSFCQQNGKFVVLDLADFTTQPSP